MTDVVYFFLNGDRTLIKIGRTANLRERLSSVRSVTHEDCVCCGAIQNLTHRQAIKLETALHHKFKDYKHHSEWFEREPVERYILEHLGKIQFPPENPQTCNFLFDLRTNEYYGIPEFYRARLEQEKLLEEINLALALFGKARSQP